MNTYIIELRFIDTKYKTKHTYSMESEHPNYEEAMIKACAIQACIDIYADHIQESVSKNRIKVLYCELVKL